jgi:hypothetical protein
LARSDWRVFSEIIDQRLDPSALLGRGWLSVTPGLLDQLVQRGRQGIGLLK